MDIFLDNFSWMIPNVALASLAVVFGLLYKHNSKKYLGIPLFILWILFLPNSIYLVTDLEYLPGQWMQIETIERPVLLIQFTFLIMIGVLSYFVSLLPIEKAFKKFRVKGQNRKIIIGLVNFAVAFGVVLGKVERTHSWYVFTQPLRVYEDIVSVLTSPVLILAIIFFGIVFNIIYFSLSKRVLKLE